MSLVLALVVAASAASPRVLVAGTSFDELTDFERGRLVQLAEQGLIAAGCTVRVSTCRDDACVKAEAQSWGAGSVVLVTAARLDRDVSVVFKAMTAAGKPLARGDTMVDVKKLADAGPALEKFARELKAVSPPGSAAADAPVATPIEPAPEPPPQVSPAAEVRETPAAPRTVSYTRWWVAGGAAALLIVSAICFGLAGSHDAQLGSARSLAPDGSGQWSITRAQADALRGSVRLESALGGSFAVLAVAAGAVALIAW